MKKSIKTSLICGIAIIFTVCMCILIGKIKAKENNTGSSAKGGFSGNAVVSVKSFTAKNTTLEDYVITNGEVESQSAIDVFPSMSGKIAEINVMLGSHVNKGDIIAKIDPSEPGTKYALSPVEAPISGSIVSSPSKIGAKVSTASAITMIGDIENLQISAPVPERYIAELKTGLSAEISLEAYPDVIFTAHVTRVSPVVDKATRTKEIILNFDKKDSRINAGMFAKVKLFTSRYSGYVAVPADCVVQNDKDDAYLFVLNDDNSVTKRYVKTGKSIDSMIQITDNLVDGEKVIIEGMLSLADGAKVIDISNQEENKQ